MARPYLYTEEQVVNAAMDLVREKGTSGLTSRALGAKLGTSSRPVFTRFKDMAAVWVAVTEGANALYQSYRQEELAGGKYPPYKASGMAYIRFAREEKELFRLLFMRDRSQEEKRNAEEADELVALIGKQLGLGEADARRFYLEMWVYVHGIAAMIATNYLDWDEASASRAVTDVYEGLKRQFTEAARTE
ncbi:MAG TPA: TetR/AcrR family transcriptional regulator [Clostridiales bacterium]|nr:TetR/AcrR family transcriptional regulator [Clostridiales bacterium]